MSFAKRNLTPLTGKTVSALLAVSLIGFAAGGATACGRAQAYKSDDAAATAPVRVETAEVTEVDTPVVLQLTGSLRGSKEASLAANAAGRVLRTFVERGDEIKQGAVIAQLDTSAATLSLLEAKVQVDTSRTQEGINLADCTRYEQLRTKGAISALEYDQATAKCKTAPLGLQVAQVRQDLAAKNVGDGTIRAPFSGVVSERYVEVGEYVQPASKVISIVQSNDVRLEFTVAEANIATVTAGADVSFVVAAYPEKVFHGTVRFVSGAVRTATRDLVAEAVVANGERLLRPGMFANVSLSTGTRKLAAVPLAAVFERLDKKRVYVVSSGHLQERIVQYGPRVGGALSVESGVNVGEKVVVGNLANLTNGARVE